MHIAPKYIEKLNLSSRLTVSNSLIKWSPSTLRANFILIVNGTDS